MIKNKVKFKKAAKILLLTFGVLASLYIILLIPTEKNEILSPADKQQFIWNRDSLWHALENMYAAARNEDCSKLNIDITNSFKKINALLAKIERTKTSPDNQKYLEIEAEIFNTAPLAAVCQNRSLDFVNLFSKIRAVVKKQSEYWDMNDSISRQTLYKLIYGGRAAVEELVLQSNKNVIPSLILGTDEKSETPSTEILGIIIHSGDILVSRGGAPTSALIARGSDYPGNFSHIALAYVNEHDKKLSIIEAHIEKGVAVSSIDDYLKDKKLRIMVLRLRSDLPQMLSDKMIPHKAAKLAYERAVRGHIAYDFAMNYSDSTKLFCSEVASSVYKKYGVNLWKGLSSISSYGTASWLKGFGVKNFVTQEPSDLEYDPQVTVIAEWRDPETLYKDHIDNAVIEALLENAESGKELKYDWFLLPIARVMKLYCVIQNMFGKIGSIPEGMSAESALRHQKLLELHKEIFENVVMQAEKFKTDKSYKPPYWRLVEFARESIKSKLLL